MTLFERLLNEDSVEIKSTSSNSSSSNENKPKNYGEYLDAQIKNAQKQKVDFSKADDNKRKTIAKNYATIAKSKYSNLQGLPKNDNEADDMLKASINKNAMDNAADNTNATSEAEAAKAQQEIDDLTKELTESIKNELSDAAKERLSTAEKIKEKKLESIKEYFSKKQKKDESLNDNEDYLSLKNVFFK